MEELLQLTAGVDFAASWVWQEADGTPVPLAGWTGSARFTTNPDAGPELELELLLEDAAGRVTLHLAGAETAALEWRWAEFAIVLTGPEGQVEKLTEGMAVVLHG